MAQWESSKTSCELKIKHLMNSGLLLKAKGQQLTLGLKKNDFYFEGEVYWALMYFNQKATIKRRYKLHSKDLFKITRAIY